MPVNIFGHFPHWAGAKWPIFIICGGHVNRNDILMNENMLFGCFWVFFRGFNRGFHPFWTILVNWGLHWGAFERFCSVRWLSCSFVFGCWTFLFTDVFHQLLCGADWVRPCTVAGWTHNSCLHECIWVAVRVIGWYLLVWRWMLGTGIGGCRLGFQVCICANLTRRLEHLTVHVGLWLGR